MALFHDIAIRGRLVRCHFSKENRLAANITPARLIDVRFYIVCVEMNGIHSVKFATLFALVPIRGVGNEGFLYFRFWDQLKYKFLLLPEYSNLVYRP